MTKTAEIILKTLEEKNADSYGYREVKNQVIKEIALELFNQKIITKSELDIIYGVVQVPKIRTVSGTHNLRRIEMKAENKQRILDLWDELDNDDNSTEYILQIISDTTEIDYSAVVNCVTKNRFKEQGE